MNNFNLEDISQRVFETSLSDLKFACNSAVSNYAPHCESAIELMLLTAFGVINTFYTGPDKKHYCQLSTKDKVSDPADALITVHPQYQWEQYRIDFRIDYLGLDKPIFIECDGHDFHERTKEQAERDRSKDRAIQAAGIPILRFTGREIYRDPVGCVHQIVKFAAARFRSKGG